MDFSTLDAAALAALRTEKQTAFDALVALPAPSKAELAQAGEIGNEIDAIDAEAASREPADADAVAALKDRKFGADKIAADLEAEPEPEPVEEPTDKVEDPAEPAADVVDAPVETPAAPAEATSTIKELAALTTKPAAPATKPEGKLTIVASADVGFGTGTEITVAQMGEGAINRLKALPEPTGGPKGDGSESDWKKYPVAQLELGYDPKLTIMPRDSEETVLEKMEYASSEDRLEGESLVAANGWCAPSETDYTIEDWGETLEGILSVPEVQVRRGGFKWTPGPQFSDFYSQAGFIQTEAQAIAGTTKPFYEVTCPSFSEARLDAVGVGIKVPILLNAAYPEMTARFTSGTMLAHQHMINANVIGRMVTAAGAARDLTATGLGSTTSDLMEALGLVAQERRQANRMALKTTIELVVPFWVLECIRDDLERRQGMNAAVTDQFINTYFAVRHIKVSWVYDWQVLSGNVYPDTFQVLAYPAGTFVKGVSQVINLSAIYDAASLAVNIYTGLFMEQGLLVAKKKWGADLMTLAICDAGRTGAANLTCS